MKKKSKLLVSAKPGCPTVKFRRYKVYFNHVQVENYPTPEEATQMFIDTIKYVYNDNKNYVDELFSSIYGRPVKFKESLSDLLIKIKTLMVQAGESIEEVVSKIRNYLGYNCSFNRFESGRLIPCSSDRILKAYQLVKEKKSFVSIEDALYL